MASVDPKTTRTELIGGAVALAGIMLWTREGTEALQIAGVYSTAIIVGLYALGRGLAKGGRNGS